jgi:3-hydroxyacyl-[acyl-carrier-protein] dehydratase
MLHNFYNIKSKHFGATTARYYISLNREHPIYAAHFPDNPITPGACLMQICKELTEDMLGKPLFMQTVKNVKFLKIITPDQTSDVEVSLTVIRDESKYKVNAVISGANESVFTKLSLIFQPINQ